jgi:hypothetical protein
VAGALEYHDRAKESLGAALEKEESSGSARSAAGQEIDGHFDAERRGGEST